MRTTLTAATLCTLLTASTLAIAQNAGAPAASGPNDMDKLMDFKSTGKMNAIPSIPQDPQKAAEIEKTLSRIKLPQGFHISLYAQVPDARMIAVGPQGVVTFVSTRKNKIYALTDRTRAGHATEVKEFAPTVEFKNPNGICFSKDGFLYTIEQIVSCNSRPPNSSTRALTLRLTRSSSRAILSPPPRKASTIPPVPVRSARTTSSTPPSVSLITSMRRANMTCTTRRASAASSA